MSTFRAGSSAVGSQTGSNNIDIVMFHTIYIYIYIVFKSAEEDLVQSKGRPKKRKEKKGKTT